MTPKSAKSFKKLTFCCLLGGLLLVGCRPLTPEEHAQFARAYASGLFTPKPIDVNDPWAPVRDYTRMMDDQARINLARQREPILIQQPSSPSVRKLMLFGGRDHMVYLGCLSCFDLDLDSIWNELGKYGSDLSIDSIWNDLGQYGSDLSNYSPWNNLAQEPPIIMDADGNSYGLLTVNDVLPGRMEDLALWRRLLDYKHRKK